MPRVMVRYRPEVFIRRDVPLESGLRRMKQVLPAMVTAVFSVPGAHHFEPSEVEVEFEKDDAAQEYACTVTVFANDCLEQRAIFERAARDLAALLKDHLLTGTRAFVRVLPVNAFCEFVVPEDPPTVVQIGGTL